MTLLHKALLKSTKSTHVSPMYSDSEAVRQSSGHPLVLERRLPQGKYSDNMENTKKWSEMYSRKKRD